ncbi:MAG: Fe-S cluster assembly protein SufB [Candidatus Sungbacteria bacterium RIFCSPHIGHO2_02_FULL_52_23]|uniref:Fe-S cluster assembly protein SufB n=1 Tax=Candidatus Sungbacteria bacterium RIFCSPHIGHO2_02_FULL_52_23 TaxID=1802274 RepID=A0A1G2KSL7_9BACT|nr:MAG: Fe-S cluster assembly protein SufB [Candidatus Sungbacteria bacterium RIFCSPHIGHO2_02_FULL_52_23]
MVKLLSKISDAQALWERSDPERWVSRTGKGISQKIVEEISSLKGEPDWMREKRLAAYRFFESKQMPAWGVDLSGLNFDDITFFIRPDERRFKTWDEVPGDIRRVYDGLGIPEAEQKFLAGLVGQYESESFYGRIREKWEKQGVIFTDTDTAVKKYPDLVKEYFMTRCVPIADHKFAALHGAVWSGGSFVYIPKGVHVDLPLQAYFRMNASQSGQFEHTLIIAEEGSSVHYIESCTAPKYTKDSLHSAVVEIFVKKGASVRYTTIQNWSKNVYNLNTKRAIVEEDGKMEWVGGSLGSKATMLYPMSVLTGRGAHARHLNIALAGPGQWKDTGAKVIHGAPHTSSRVISKSISLGGGRSSYRGLLKIAKGARGSKAHVQCDALLLDEHSQSDTYPYMEIYEDDVSLMHEATVNRVTDDQLFYLRSRGLSEEQALDLILAGFLDPISRELPLDYAIELNRFIRMEMAGSVG